MSSSFSRPSTRQVDALFDPGRPSRLPGMDPRRVERTPDGRFTDYSSAEIAGKNASRGYEELSNFIDQAVETAKPIYNNWLNDQIDQEMAEVAKQPGMVEAYKNGDAKARAWISSFRPQTRYQVNDGLARAGVRGYQIQYTTSTQASSLLRNPKASPELNA